MEDLINSYKPLFSHVFHLSPAEIERMDLADWHRYRMWADDFNERQAGKDNPQASVNRVMQRAKSR